MSTSRELQEELVKSANLIRQKYRALKRGKFLDEELRLESLKPITEPLQKLTENVDCCDRKELAVVGKPAPVGILPSSSSISLPLTPSRIPRIQLPAPSRLEFGKLAAKYLSTYMLQDDSTDTTYGIRKDPASVNDFLIGNAKVVIANDDVAVGDKIYEGTEGLWELLTQKEPKNYTQDDLDNYKEILEHTNAHKKKYNPDGDIASNSGKKYKGIIGPLFKKTGAGMREVTGNDIDYVYWNNPNELVDRLRLLVLSRDAGNTGVNNEIDSIIQELIEGGFISK